MTPDQRRRANAATAARQQRVAAGARGAVVARAARRKQRTADDFAAELAVANILNVARRRRLTDAILRIGKTGGEQVDAQGNPVVEASMTPGQVEATLSGL